MAIQAVTFDVTRTLIHADVAAIYTRILGRHGIEVSEDEMARLIPLVWKEMDCRATLGRDRFSSHPRGPRGWWGDFLDRLCAYLEQAPSPFAAAELFHHFGRAEAWKVYPDVRPALAKLKAMGLRLGVVSNWDDRLEPLLDELDLARWLDAVTISSRVGVEKPDPRIFLHALEQLGVSPDQAAHVGDQPREDVEGALAAGMVPVHLVRRAGPDEPLEPDQLRTLEELPERVAARGALLP